MNNQVTMMLKLVFSSINRKLKPEIEKWNLRLRKGRFKRRWNIKDKSRTRINKDIMLSNIKLAQYRVTPTGNPVDDEWKPFMLVSIFLLLLSFFVCMPASGYDSLMVQLSSIFTQVWGMDCYLKSCHAG